jgi:hypothetical protein
VVCRLLSWINHAEAFRLLLDRGAMEIGAAHASRTAWGQALVNSRFLDGSPERAAQALMDIVSAGDAVRRDAAVRLLHEVGREGLLTQKTRVQYYFTVLATHSDEAPFSPLGLEVPKFKQLAYNSLVALGEKATPVLLQRMREGSRDEKIYAIHALAASAAGGNDLLYGMFKNAFAELDPWVRLNAISAARRKFYRDAMDALLNLCRSVGGHPKRVAARAFCVFAFCPLDTPIPRFQAWWEKVRGEPDAALAAMLAERAVEALLGAEEDVRILAADFLRRATGADLPYDPTADAGARAAGAAAWAAWWKENKAAFQPPADVWP